MKLFHFTRPSLLPAIRAQGLTPCASEKNGESSNGKPVVWLTEYDDNALMREQRHAMLVNHGFLCGPRYRGLPEATVCLAVEFGSGACRLRRYKGSMLSALPPVGEIARHWWTYDRIIKPELISVHKTVESGVVSWDMLPADVRAQTQEGRPLRLTFPDQSVDDLLDGKSGPPGYVEAHKQEMAA